MEIVTFLNSCLFQTLCYNTVIGGVMTDKTESNSDNTNRIIKSRKEALHERKEIVQKKGEALRDKCELNSDTTNEVKGEIRDFFQRERERKNLNVRDLGALADVSYTVIYDLEKRNILPKIETLIKLANALGFNVSIKNSHDVESPAFSLIFYKDNLKRKQFLFEQSISRNSYLSTDEKFRKLLLLKGLYADDIKEIESFIAFKLSQH